LSTIALSVYPPPALPDDEYESVEGRDPTTTKLKREYEAEVEHKVASDYQHIVLAYGIIWSLFAVYGALLWWRSARLRRDLDALSEQVRDR
jgi:hypothetical protein